MQGDVMNTICRRTLVHALFASFAATAIAAHADPESRDSYAAGAEAAAVEVCASSPNGMVPKAKLVKAIHRMLDMGETPRAAKLSKEEKRNMQFEVFWKEFTQESGG
jgi:hypothetical protein